jgi:hypothetical protein
VLDKEDCAHLDALQKQRQEGEIGIRQATKNKLGAFGAAQAVNRMEHGMKQDEDRGKAMMRGGTSTKGTAFLTGEKPAVATKPQFPTITAEKRPM